MVMRYTQITKFKKKIIYNHCINSQCHPHTTKHNMHELEDVKNLLSSMSPEVNHTEWCKFPNNGDYQNMNTTTITEHSSFKHFQHVQILEAKPSPSLDNCSKLAAGCALATLAMAWFSSGVPLSRNAPTTFPSFIQYVPNLCGDDAGSLSPKITVSPTLSP